MKKKPGSRYSSLLFFVPIIIVAVVVVAAYVWTLPGGGKSGTLEVQALVYPYHARPTGIGVRANVNGTAVTTPGNLSLIPGSYVVTFPSEPGYWPPSSRRVPVQEGLTVYAIGRYVPIKKVISVGLTSFNATKLSAVKSVTPVFWLNVSNQIVTIQSTFFGTRAIQPGGNTSYVFQSTGTFMFWLLGNQNSQGLITVS